MEKETTKKTFGYEKEIFKSTSYTNPGLTEFQ